MMLEQLLPSAASKVQFTHKFRKFVPASNGCYILTTFKGEVLYVGLTDSLHRRFGEHRESEEKRKVTAQGAAYWFCYLICAPKETARIERTWMNQHMELHGKLPLLNKVHSPVR